MTSEPQRGVIVIPEDAYKQNMVYRSWEDIRSGETKRKEAPLPLAKAALPVGTAPTVSVG